MSITDEEIKQSIGFQGIYCINQDCPDWISIDRYGCRRISGAAVTNCNDFIPYKPKPKEQTMQLTAEEKSHVYSSIAHWEQDIMKRFQEGCCVVVLGKKYLWGKNVDGVIMVEDQADVVQMFSDDCPLCLNYRGEADSSDEAMEDQACCICPFYKVNSYTCDHEDGPWTAFNLQPTIQQAIRMVNSLKELVGEPT